MLNNRSIPQTTVIPVLAYADCTEAAAWLCRVFGFRERLRIGEHRVQLIVGDGAVVVSGGGSAKGTTGGHSIMIRVDDANAQYERAKREGAHVLNEPATYAYGERQFNVEDPGGHIWTFTESVSDVDPAEWGGEMVE